MAEYSGACCGSAMVISELMDTPVGISTKKEYAVSDLTSVKVNVASSAAGAGELTGKPGQVVALDTYLRRATVSVR